MKPELLQSFREEFEKRLKSMNQWIRYPRRGRYYHVKFDPEAFLARFEPEDREFIANGYEGRKGKLETKFSTLRKLFSQLTEDELEEIKREIANG
jgi:hypothetical protein